MQKAIQAVQKEAERLRAKNKRLERKVAEMEASQELFQARKGSAAVSKLKTKLKAYRDVSPAIVLRALHLNSVRKLKRTKRQLRR